MESVINNQSVVFPEQAILFVILELKFLVKRA